MSERPLGHDDILALVARDETAMAVLHAAESLGLPDWCIGAGFVRNRVWDHLTGRPGAPARDIDLAYVDPTRAGAEHDERAEAAARRLLPGLPWEIRNQVRMARARGETTPGSVAEALSTWPETATCLGVRCTAGRVSLVAPLGTADLLDMVVRPSPAFDTPQGRARVRERVRAKGWLRRWPELRLAACLSGQP